MHCDADSLEAAGGASERIVASSPSDYETEFLDLEVAVKVVDSVSEAITHINTHGSHHTDAIFCAPLAGGSSTESPVAAQFTRAVASANVFVNASTRFADGFRYGFGTEVGISTGKTHARGPVGLEGLVIYKYIAKAVGAGAQMAGAFGGEGTRSWAHTDLDKTYPSF